MIRVAITGVGIVSPVGIGRREAWANLVAGRSGIGPLTLFDASAFPIRIGGEVKDFACDEIIARYPEAAATRDRKILLGLVAAEEAMADAGLLSEDWKDALVCVGVGLETICLEDLTPFAGAANLSEAIADGTRKRSEQPFQTPLDQTARLLAGRYGFGCGSITNCSACAAGAQAIGEAFGMIRSGEAGLALAGATDSMLNPLGLGGFSLLRVLSEENHRPQEACRPFDATREGTVLGEGAAFVVLESLERARERGAAIYAEMLGYGSSLDAFAATDPDPTGRGAVDAMRRAMRVARLAPEQIDCISAHGTGTPKNDAAETAGIKEAFGRRAYEIPVHAVKSMTGHMIAASGAAEAAVAALTLAVGTVPPTLNLQARDPDCDLDYVPRVARPFGGRTVLSNSFGFGGQNAALIFGKHGVGPR